MTVDDILAAIPALSQVDLRAIHVRMTPLLSGISKDADEPECRDERLVYETFLSIMKARGMSQIPWHVAKNLDSYRKAKFGAYACFVTEFVDKHLPDARKHLRMVAVRRVLEACIAWVDEKWRNKPKNTYGCMATAMRQVDVCWDDSWPGNIENKMFGWVLELKARKCSEKD